MSLTRWSLHASDDEAAAELAAALRIPRVAAALLLARGCTDVRSAERFLSPSLDDLRSAEDLPDIDPACRRIAAAIEQGERILVHGDYDADGVCATALLTRCLRKLGADVEALVPHRQHDGYDIRVPAVTRARESGIRLIITVDCGIGAHEAAREAEEAGIDLVVTDHHLPGEELPPAAAIVNPNRADSRYPFRDLCGTGVAYKLATALVERLGIRSPAFKTAYLDLAALATVADSMPLLDENRILVAHGLAKLRATRNPGLQALMDISGIRPETIGVRSLGFALGPRINAAGRVDAAERALDLLLTDEPAAARATAELLDGFNRDRQAETTRIYEEAVRLAQNHPHDRILVLSSARWHQGVIGIVAGRLVEALGRPAILIAIDEEEGLGRGSARSIPGFHIQRALSGCGELLERCGGHEAAAGFDILPDRIDALRSRLLETAADDLTDELLEPVLNVDAELAPGDVNLDLALQLARLEPFGTGNPRPVFLTRGLEVVEQRRIVARTAQKSDHMRLLVGRPGEPQHKCIAWQLWNRSGEASPGAVLDLAYELEVDTYNGYRSAQLSVRDLRSGLDV